MLMSETNAGGKKSRWSLSLDVWAVLVSLLAALLVRTGIIHRIPW
jgi:hypothetical protein